MELTVKERLLLLSVVPAQGDILTLRIVRQLREALSFSEEEQTEWELLQEGGNVRWNVAKAESKDVSMGAKAQAIVAATLRERSEKKQLTEDFVDLYGKFVVEE